MLRMKEEHPGKKRRAASRFRESGSDCPEGRAAERGYRYSFIDVVQRGIYASDSAHLSVAICHQQTDSNDLRYMKCTEVLQQDPSATKAALEHPFLQACSDGSVSHSQFNTWLQQDYNFVTAFANFADKVRAAAPQGHARVYLDGCAALSDELGWFQEKLKERGLLIGGPLHATCAAYVDLLGQLEQQSYAVQAVAFWLVEYIYNKAWSLASPVAEPYHEFAERWGDSVFSKYVGILEQQADEAMQSASEKEQASIREASLAILTIEQRFWQMAMDAA